MRRLPIITLGLCALYWAWLVLPELRMASSFANTSSRILAGEPFQQDELERQVKAFASMQAFAISYSRLRAADPILQSRTLEMAMDRADPAGLDTRMAALSTSLRGALASSPSDALLWTFVYWLESMHEGPSDRTRGYLTLSYALSPLEGTVAFRRNRFALSNFALLDSVTQGKIAGEFAAMVESGFMDYAVMNIVGPGWIIRDRLLAGLADIDHAQKLTFAKSVYRQGVDIVVPGIEGIGVRPWQR